MSYAGAIKVSRESEGNTEASSNTALQQQQQHQRQEQQHHAVEEVAIDDEVKIVFTVKDMIVLAIKENMRYGDAG